MSTTLTRAELSTIYEAIGEVWREVEPPHRVGVIVGVDAPSLDLYWICQDMAGPVLLPRATLEKGGELSDLTWVPGVLENDLYFQKVWQFRLASQAAFAGPPEHWFFGLLCSALMAKIEASVGTSKDRGQRMLRGVFPFLGEIDEASKRRLAVLVPEYSFALRSRERSGSWPSIFPVAPKISSTLQRSTIEAVRPIGGTNPYLRRFYAKKPTPAPGADPTPAVESTVAPSRGRVLPLVRVTLLADPDEDHYVLMDGGETMVLLDAWGSFLAVPRDQVQVDAAQELISTEDFQAAMACAFEEASPSAFLLAGSLASLLEDPDAGVFWYLYGSRWVAASDKNAIDTTRHAAISALRNVTLKQRRDWEHFAPELRVSGPSRVRGTVPALAKRWVESYNLVSMAQRVHHAVPGFLEDATEIFSFGAPPFDRGAPPSPLLAELDGFAGEQQAQEISPSTAKPTSAWQVPIQPPRGQGRAEAEAIQLPSVSAAPPVVSSSETCLLEVDWNMPSGVDAFVSARQAVFRWLGEKLGITIPERWNDGAHEAEHKGVRLESEASEHLIALRFEHPDHAQVARRWRIEIALGAGVEGRPGVVAVRLLALDSTRLSPPETATPRMLRDLLSAPGLFLAGHALGRCWTVGTNADWLSLRDMLADSRRDFVVVVSGPDEALDLPVALAPLALHVQLQRSSAPDYARRRPALAAGTCHVYGLAKTEPLVVAAQTSPLRDALWAAHAHRGPLPSLPAFADLRRQLRDITILRRLRGVAPEAPLPTTPVAHAPPLPDQGRSPELEELLRVAEHELQEALADKRALEADLDHVSSQLRDAKAALYAARAAAGEVPGMESAADLSDIPEDFAGLEAWLPQLGDRLVVAPKALKEALSITDYRNEKTAIAAIHALYEHYWPMVMRGCEAARERWQAFLKDNRLRCGPVGTAPDSARYGSSYEVTIDGKTYTMGMHIQGHSARDTRRCLRLYYCMDKDKDGGRLVLGHFPTHLPCHLHYTS